MFTTHYLTVSPPVSESLRMIAGLGNNIIGGRRKSREKGKEREKAISYVYNIMYNILEHCN